MARIPGVEDMVEKLLPPTFRPAISVETHHMPNYASVNYALGLVLDRLDRLEAKINELIDERNLQIKEDGTVG